MEATPPTYDDADHVDEVNVNLGAAQTRTEHYMLAVSPQTLEDFRVSQLDSVYYIPSYVTEAQEHSLLDQISSARSKWTNLKRRRLQNWGGIVEEKGMIPEPLPTWLSTLLGRLHEDVGLFRTAPNHVLVNEYQPGEGIMAHEDGPLYFPLVAILSLRSSAVIRFTQKQPSLNSGVKESHTDSRPKAVSLVLRPRSLLIFKDAAYEDYLHGIEETEVETLDATVANRKQSGTEEGQIMLPREDTRISLTCRSVTRTLKISKLFKLK